VRQTVFERIRYQPPRPRLPGLAALRSWRTTGRGDLIAGIAVAAYLVPQCLAYARLAGLAPVTGLWAALPALVAYAFLGTSRVLSVGPESASALLVGAAVIALTDTGHVDSATAAAAIALAVGALAILAWVARLGFLADLLSKPVLVGYLAAVALTMVISQLPNLTGIEATHRDTVGRALDVVRGIDGVDAAPLVMGIGVVAALVLLQRWPRIPGTLLVVLAATAVTAAFDLEQYGVQTVGTVPRGLPAVAFPSVPAGLWPEVFVAALGITIVSFSGNVLTGRAFARSGDVRIDADQELLALGGTNALAGLAGGFAVSSSESRTALARVAGASTQLVSLVAAGSVAVVLLVAGPVLEQFPLAALAGLVLYAALRLVDVGEMRRVLAFRRSEAALMAAAFVGVAAFGLLIGVAVAVGLSVADLLRRVARAHDAVQGSVPGLAGLHDVDDYPEATTTPGLVVYRYDAPLFFANAEDFRARVLSAVTEEEAPVEWVILNMEANVEVDLTAVDMLEDLRSDLASREIVLALARVKHDLALYLERTGLLARIGDDHVFPTLPTALEGFRSRPHRPPPSPEIPDS
jgi:high affinity sulfate transporter 1